MLGKLSHQEPQLTREEVEKRLESRQISFGIEKAPMMLPMEIFSHDNSNQDRYYALKSCQHSCKTLAQLSHGSLLTQVLGGCVFDQERFKLKN